MKNKTKLKIKRNEKIKKSEWKKQWNKLMKKEWKGVNEIKD